VKCGIVHPIDSEHKPLHDFRESAYEGRKEIKKPFHGIAFVCADIFPGENLRR
jgi:hypothetical protein